MSNLSSDHDFSVREFKLHIRLHSDSLGFSLFLPLSLDLPYLHTCALFFCLTLSLKINKLKKKKAKGSYYFIVITFLDSLPDLIPPQCQSEGFFGFFVCLFLGYLWFYSPVLLTLYTGNHKDKQLKLSFINRLGLCPAWDQCSSMC